MNFYFKYKLTEEEYGTYNVFSVWLAPWQKKVRLNFITKTLLYCFFGAIAGHAIYTSISNKKSSQFFNSSYILIALGITAVYTTISFLDTPNRVKAKAKKFLEKEENKELLSEGNLEITESGLFSSDQRTQTKYQWDSIVKYCVTKNTFYLFVNSLNAIVIPKRLFNTEKEIKDFDKFLTEKIPLSSSFRSIGI